MDSQLSRWPRGSGLSLLNRTTVSASSNGPVFVEFESGHVRPIAMSADGATLFAVNTPNGTLEIFDLTSGKLNLTYRVPVGLEPVAVAARSQQRSLGDEPSLR